MRLLGLNHVGLRVLDRERSEAFYRGTLGLRAHPTKSNWLLTTDGEFSLHLMPGTPKSHDGNDVADLARHVALETDDLEGVVDELVAAGYEPFQTDITAEHRRRLADSSDLTHGIGTVFVSDPDGNLVEFVDRRRGIFPALLAEADHA